MRGMGEWEWESGKGRGDGSGGEGRKGTRREEEGREGKEENP